MCALGRHHYLAHVISFYVTEFQAPTGGRVTVMQTALPNIGPGKLQNREDPNQRASTKPANLQPSTDFYKLLSLEAAGQQIAIDMFLLNHQYADHATIGTPN